jgi:hypothetical protein
MIERCMMRSSGSLLLSASLAILLGVASHALGSVPFPATSTCTISVTQYASRPACISNWEPDVIRLTPAGSNAVPPADRASISVRVRDQTGTPVSGAVVRLSERYQGGLIYLNISNGGSTTAVTDTEGLATVELHAASGNGIVDLCADGVALCSVQVRAPDVVRGGTVALCGLGTGASAVAGADITNPACGFLIHWGAVTVGVNEGFDMNCDRNVSGPDITGQLGKGGVLQYFGDTGTLGSLNACAP